MHRPLLCAALLAVALGAAACDDTEELTPVDPNPTEITEPVFTGRLAINGSVTTAFDSVSAGTVTAIIDTLEPSSVAIGVVLGVWNGTSCENVVVNDNAGVGGGVAGYANGAGHLCARAFDAGRLTEPVNFSITIKHH